MDKIIERTLENLKKNRMTGYFLEDRAKIFPLLKTLVPEKSTVGYGNSETLESLGVFDFFRKGNYTFYDISGPGITREKRHEYYTLNFSADTFLTGANALTQRGEILNIDGNGNRVAPLIYGPKQVIVVAGVNKIAEDFAGAACRARNIAAPLDAKRLKTGTPCETLGKCVDCRHPHRICNQFVVTAGQLDGNRVKVIIVNEPLGF